MSAQIGKSLVGRGQPAPLGLNAGPEVIIVCSCRPCPRYRRCIVSARDCQVGNCRGRSSSILTRALTGCLALERKEVRVVHRFGGEFHAGLDVIGG